MERLKCNVGEYAVIVNKEKKFLILRLPLNKEFTKEMWMLPGGRLDSEDQPMFGLQREVTEETGLEVEVSLPVHVARWGIENPMKYSVFYLCKLIGGGVVKISSEHVDSKWVSFDEIESIPWHNVNSKVAVEKSKQLLDAGLL